MTKATVATGCAWDQKVLHPASVLAMRGLCADPSRRTFLKLAAMSATGFVVGLGPRAKAIPPATPGRIPTHPTDQLAYLTVQEAAAGA